MMAAQNVNVKREMVANASEAPTKRIFWRNMIVPDIGKGKKI